MSNTLEVPAFKSMYDVLQFIIDNPKINMFHFPKGKSEAPISAFIRTQTGETLKDESTGHSRLTSKKIVGTEKDSLFITVPRDKSSRILDNGEFSFRTIPIASPYYGQRVHSISILPNFSSEWIEIDLENMPVFPKLEGKEAEWFGEGMVKLYQLFAEKTFLAGQLTALKKKLGKDKEVLASGFRYHWEDPTGTVQGVLDKDGKEVDKVGNPFDNGVILEPEIERQKFAKIEDTSRIVETHLKKEEISEKASALHQELRPFELGIIERIGIFETICIGGVNFRLKRSSVKSYDFPADAAEKIKSGEYRIADVPKKLGRWLCDPIAVPASPAPSTKTLVPTS